MCLEVGKDDEQDAYYVIYENTNRRFYFYDKFTFNYSVGRALKYGVSRQIRKYKIKYRK